MIEMNKTYQHIADDSKYIKFDPTNTEFDNSIVDVQSALSSLNPIAMQGYKLPVANKQAAGIIRIATDSEIESGEIDTVAVTPKQLKESGLRPQATESVVGVSRYATNAEANTPSTGFSITPKTLDYVFNTRTATETKTGTAKISTQTIAITGTDDTTMMTPLKVKLAIGQFGQSVDTATETRFGTVKLATVQQAQDGTIGEGFAISPKTFVGAKASDSKYGVVKFGTPSEVSNRTANMALNTINISSLVADASRFGVVKLTKNIGALSGGALAADANVVPLSGGNMTGRLKLNNDDYITRKELASAVPIGFICMAAYNPQSMYGGVWVPTNGRSLKKSEHAELFAAIGYTYGGSGDNFNIPNMDNLFPRAASNSRPAGTKENYALPEGIKGTFVALDIMRVPNLVSGSFNRTKNRWNANMKYGNNDDWGSQYEYDPSLNGVPLANENRPANMALWFVIRIK